MKILLLSVLLSFAACDLFKPKPEAPTSSLGVCLSAEEAAAQGKKVCKSGCTCLSDVHGGVLNNTEHCHGSPQNCSIEPIK